MVALPVAAQDGQQPSGSQGITEDMLVVAPDLYTRAVDAFNAQDYEKAVLDASIFILLNPTYARAYYLRALSYESLQQSDNALADLGRAIDHAPTPDFEAVAHVVRANIYMDQEDSASALEELNAAIEAAPDMPEPYFARAQIYASQERFDDALADYNRVIELAPNTAQVYQDRGSINYQLGNYQDAVDDYTHAIQNDSQNAGLYLGRGAAYTGSGDSAAAAADFLQWIRLTSTNVNQDHQLTIGQSIQVDLQDGLVYVMPFQATAGQVLNIEATRGPNVEADPIMVLVDSQGNALVGDDDSGGDLNAAIRDYTIPADGVYALLVSHSGGGSSGAVVVKLGLSASP